MRRIWLGLVAPVALFAQFDTRLNPATEKAFDAYQKSEEARMDWVARFTATKGGEIAVAPFGKDGSIDVKDGLIHDWASATVAAGGTVQQALAVLQDYANYKNFYAPEVADSRLISRNGNRWRAYLRLVKKKVLTAVLNSEYEVEYRPLAGGRWAVISRSTKMTEVDGDKELEPGRGHGFLWRLNAYWVIEPRPEGVYLECRTISLSRDIPRFLGWALRPIVSSLPRESLQFTLESTVKALGQKHPPVP
jgi:hypothetical protein